MAKVWTVLGFLALSCFFVTNGQNLVCTKEAVADIVFLVDGSSSIGPNNFREIQQFLMLLVQNLEIGPDKVRIGLVQYSNSPRTEFFLNSFQSKQQILSYINNLKYMQGGTLTGQALDFVLKNHFVEKSGSRSALHVPQIAVVVTDGESQDPVQKHASDLIARGIEIFAVGINEANEKYLKQMASEPYDEHVYSVSDFDALRGISQSVIQQLCTNVGETNRDVIQLVKGCNETAKADVVFLVDSSSSIGGRNFEQMKGFLHMAVDRFNLSPGKVRLGLAQFSDRTYQEFLLGEYANKRDLHQKIDNLVHRGGDTLTGAALTFIREHYFSQARNHVPLITIVITDGVSRDRVEEPAHKLRSLGVAVFVISVGQVNIEKLYAIASIPYRDFVFQIGSYQELDNLRESLRNKICSTLVQQSQAYAPTFLDIVILVDASVSEKEQKLIVNFLNKLTSNLALGKNANRIGLGHFNEYLTVQYLLNNDRSKNQILASFRGLPWGQRGPRKIGHAILNARQQFFDSDAGSRFSEGFKQFLLVFAAGNSADQVVQASRLIKREAVTVMGIGLSKTGLSEMNDIASPALSYLLPGKVVQVTEEINKAFESVNDLVDVECRHGIMADIAFIVDQSSNIRSSNFTLIQNFLKNTIRSLDVGVDKIRIAVVVYSDEAQAGIHFDDYMSKDDITKYINSMTSGRGKTNTGAALRFAKERVFIKARGSRKDQRAEQMAVVITDGRSTDDAASAARALRKSGVKVFAVGIRNTTEDLIDIASHPDKKFVFNEEGVNLLKSLTSDLTKTICREIANTLYDQSPERAITSACKVSNKADMYFLLDESESISKNQFDEMKSFTTSIVESLDVGPANVRIGLVKFASQAETVFNLQRFRTKAEIKKAVEAVRWNGGVIKTDRALQHMIRLFEDASRSRREEARKILFLITNGDDKATDAVELYSKQLRDQHNVIIYAIGMKNAAPEFLSLITNWSNRKFLAPNFDALSVIKFDVLREVCACDGFTDMLADVVFLIDSSESVSPGDFNIWKDIIEAMVDKFSIGPEKQRISVVQYGTETKELFPLDEFDDKILLLQNIRSISQGEMGKTFTGKALEAVFESFEYSKGGRNKAYKFLILLTDGESKDDVSLHAKYLRQNAINILSVGLKNANRTQLNDIVGEYEKVFIHEDHEPLQKISNDVLLKICSTECQKIEQADIIFLLDTSGPDDLGFSEMKELMKHVVKKSDVAQNRVRFGVITYSDFFHLEFSLKENYTQSQVLEEIDKIKASGGGRDTIQALKSAPSYFEGEHARELTEVPKVLLLITNGRAESQTWSQNWDEIGVSFYAIGTGDADEEQLKELAANKDNVRYVSNYSDLKGLQRNLIEELCIQSKPVCVTKSADLVFLIDGSESIKQPQWYMILNLTLEIVRGVSIAKDKWQVAVAQFSTTFKDHFFLNEYSTFKQVETAIKNIKQLDEGTKTWTALRLVKKYFTPEKGSRINVPVAQNLLLITDGEAKDDKDLDAVKDLRDMNVEITVIGLDKEIKLSELNEISERVFVRSFDNFNLKKTAKDIVNTLCDKADVPDHPKSNCTIDIAIGFDVSRLGVAGSLLSPEVEQAVTQSIYFMSEMEAHADIKLNISIRFGYRLVSRDGRILNDFDFKFYPEDELKNVLRLQPSEALAFNDRLLESFRQKLNDSTAEAKVLILFTDGLDDDVQHLKTYSALLKDSGVSALLIVSLEGVMHEAQQLEFGRGYSANTPLSISFSDIHMSLMKELEAVALVNCCNVTCKCTGDPGDIGPPGTPGEKGATGEKGHPGFPGDEGGMGERGPPGLNGTRGHQGCQGFRGFRGVRGYTGSKGEEGECGLDGVDGEQGDIGVNGHSGPKGNPGIAGLKGFKGWPGPKGDHGYRGDPGFPGSDNRTPGGKGERGNPGALGDPGSEGPKGSPGDRGAPGNPGRKGQAGPPGESRDAGGDPGQRGPPGYPGRPGNSGSKGDDGDSGPVGVPGVPGPYGRHGPQGEKGNRGRRGARGLPGDIGVKGDLGPDGVKGPPGLDGNSEHGSPGYKGHRGKPGCMGPPGYQGEFGVKGSSGFKGDKGHSGSPGNAGAQGSPGDSGEQGMDGHTGHKGIPGINPMPECQLVEYIRGNCPCCSGNSTTQCPVYPTELVLALDMSADMTEDAWSQMISLAEALLDDVSVAETNCPWGTRVSVVSYSSESKYLIRFSDFQKKKLLVDALKNIPLIKTTMDRDIGEAMLFVARNVFKRVREGKLVRKIAVFFTNGDSRNAASFYTAMLELRAAHIDLGVVSLNPAEGLQQALQIDNTGSYMFAQASEMIRIKRCIICFDHCKPDPWCRFNLQPQPLDLDMDLTVMLDSSDNVNSKQYSAMKELLLSLLDQVSVSGDPTRNDRRSRVAVYQQSSYYISEEFSFTQFKDRSLMKRHISKVVKQKGGTSHPVFALEWIINKIIQSGVRARSKRMVVAFIGEHSEYTTSRLEYVSGLSRCQDVEMLVVMSGKSFDWTLMERLASPPLDQHLLFMGDPDYSTRFIHTFLLMFQRGIFRRPPISDRECQRFPPREIDVQEPKGAIPGLPSTDEPPTDYEDLNGEQSTELFGDSSPLDYVEDFHIGRIESSSERKAQCFLERDIGTLCGAYVSRWYFSQKIKKCVHFWYGGCDGNENRFLTEEECLTQCWSTEYANVPLDDVNIHREVCKLEYDAGTCLDFLAKWYYNAHSGECAQFWYGGCGGNDNRFNTREDCELFCLRAKKPLLPLSKQ